MPERQTKIQVLDHKPDDWPERNSSSGRREGKWNAERQDWTDYCDDAETQITESLDDVQRPMIFTFVLSNKADTDDERFSAVNSLASSISKVSHDYLDSEKNEWRAASSRDPYHRPYPRLMMWKEQINGGRGPRKRKNSRQG